MPREQIYNSNNKKFAQTLRKNMTKEERKLWYKFLSKLPVPQRFNRQACILSYIVDFYCPTHKIVVELDGVQHYWGDTKEKDDERDKALEELGITVLRFTNKQVNQDFDNVCFCISAHIGLV